jgi:hypothetical protein
VGTVETPTIWHNVGLPARPGQPRDVRHSETAETGVALLITQRQPGTVYDTHKLTPTGSDHMTVYKMCERCFSR